MSSRSSKPSCGSTTGHTLSRPLARIVLLSLLAVLTLTTAPATAQTNLGCRPCAGFWSDGADAATAAVAEALADFGEFSTDTSGEETVDPLEQATVFVRLSADLARDRGVPGLSQVEAPLVPWISVRLHTPAPLLDHLADLDEELERLAEIARDAPPKTRFHLDWQPASGSSGDADEPTRNATEVAFLIKRAAVAVTGAQPGARLVAGPWGFTADSDLGFLEDLYANDVAAYVDGVVLTERELPQLEAGVERMRELDPGTPIVIDGIAVERAEQALVIAAAHSTRGASATMFRLPGQTASDVAPLLVLAREFTGDLSADSYSVPTGASQAYAFVRGKDLALRVIVENAAAAGSTEPSSLRLSFPDPTLGSPASVSPQTATPDLLFGGRRTGRGYQLDVQEAPEVLVLRLERAGIGEIEGVEEIEERLEVTDTRQIPVSEILRRLQAFEDDLSRRLDRYSATNTMSLRFQLGTGVGSLDATFLGDFFFEQDAGFDWAWQEFYINGVKWRRKRLPEIPLIQPEKASSLPTEILFTANYRYRLRGTGEAQGRDCWVIDFEPAVALEEGTSLWKGTLWVDRELNARVKTNAVQLGLEGEVVSNEETTFYQPIDDNGQPAAWSADAYYLPMRLVGQQIFSVLNEVTVVERELTLTNVQIDPADFDARRQALLESEATMVRDTDKGLRYLVTDEDTGQRVVQEELDASRLFLVGGAFYDDSQDFPLPLAGINWLSLDFKGTGAQTNFFFAGPLLTAAVAKPDLFGSKWEVGLDAFALAIAGTDTIYRGGEEIEAEDVESLRPNMDLAIGRPFGSFFKLEFEYSVGFNNFSRADDTADDFVVPEDHVDHQFSLTGRYNRRGWRLRAGATQAIRSDWDFWGLPGNTEFDQDQEEYTKWSAGIGKTWHLPKFQKIGVEVEYAGGENLDRFSKYQFGFFGGLRVRGYQIDLIRAEEAVVAHLSYGVNVGDVFRVDLLGDAAWATDELTGLDNELLAGIGVAGTFLGPWGTIVNLDVGVPVAGPDDGFSAFIAFLKLFR